MKKLILLLTLFSGLRTMYAQQMPGLGFPNRYYSIIQGGSNPRLNHVELASDVDTSWFRWKERGYSFGFNSSLTPMYTTVNGILSTPYMIQVRGNAEERNKKRWGYHVFEGYAKDDKSRITMLVNKHIELEKPVAELYYYGTAYNHSEQAYNWFKIGRIGGPIRRPSTFVFVWTRQSHLLRFIAPDQRLHAGSDWKRRYSHRKTSGRRRAQLPS